MMLMMATGEQTSRIGEVIESGSAEQVHCNEAWWMANGKSYVVASVPIHNFCAPGRRSSAVL